MSEPESVNPEPFGASDADATAEAPPPAGADESTVGTGSVFAIGCSILALLFICVGVAIFMWRQLN